MIFAPGKFAKMTDSQVGRAQVVIELSRSALTILYLIFLDELHCCKHWAILFPSGILSCRRVRGLSRTMAIQHLPMKCA